MQTTLVRFVSSLVLAAGLIFLSVSFVSAQDKDWRPVTPQELQLNAPKVEPDADAEVIFWEVRVDDSDPMSMVMKHYIRVKIFTERGREKYSKVDIPFVRGIRIKGIMGRVIKADGSIVDVTKADVLDREIVKTDKVKVKAKSFAVPNIEPGVIVEYRYQEVYEQGSAEDMRMIFQHDVPIQNITYYFKPYESGRSLMFNMPKSAFVKDKNGFYKASMDNVPAIKSEPHMPPEDEVRSWLLVYYNRDEKATASDFWARAGGYIARRWEIKDTLKPNKDLKAAATGIIAGATTPDDQMEKLFAFCKTKVKNITYDAQLTEDQKAEIKPNKSTADTYKKLQGTDTDINELFASLATALGFEARLAFGGDKSEKFFNTKDAHESFIHFSAVAVKVNGQWKYYSPGDLFVPYGMLSWNEEDTAVLLLGYKDYITTKTTGSGPEMSMAKRTGRFKLLEDGTLEGDVKLEYTGQFANNYKLDNYKASPGKREETLKDTIKSQMSTAEVSAIVIENVTDPEKPFIYQYKIRVPNYAQKTGKRMFFQPGVFKTGSVPLFPSATRKYAVFFHFPWSEKDDIEIEIPKGYVLDNADAPPLVADSNKIGSLSIGIGFNNSAGVLKYDRNFFFGNGGNTLFPVSAYAPIKALFENFNSSNNHVLTLKQL